MATDHDHDDHPILESQPFPGPLVRVRGRLSRDGRVTWSPCLRTFTERRSNAATRAATAPAYAVSFETASGHVLASAPVQPKFFATDAQHASFTTRLPFQQQTARVVLRRDGQALPDPLVVPPQPARFHLLSPRAAGEIDPDGVLHLSWRRQEPDGHPSPPVTYFIRFTNNADNQLRPGVNLHDESFDLDLRDLPGGAHCAVQVLATNGYHTSFVQTPQFALPVRPPSLLLGENEGPMLVAQGLSPAHGPLTGTSLRWLVDGRPSASGVTFDARTGAGLHAISVEATDPDQHVLIQDLGVYDGASGRRVRPPAGL
jgi:hypothetical protein